MLQILFMQQKMNAVRFLRCDIIHLQIVIIQSNSQKKIKLLQYFQVRGSQSSKVGQLLL